MPRTKGIKVVEDQANEWKTLIDKYSIDEEENEANEFNFDNLVEEIEDSDGEADEAIEETLEETDDKILASDFSSLTRADQEKQLSKCFPKNFVSDCQIIRSQLSQKLEKMNLPFWNYSSTSIITNETREDIKLKTKDFDLRSKTVKKSKNLNHTTLQFGGVQPQLQLNRIVHNNVPVIDNSDQLVSQFKNILNTAGNHNFTISVQERVVNINCEKSVNLKDALNNDKTKAELPTSSSSETYIKPKMRKICKRRPSFLQISSGNSNLTKSNSTIYRPNSKKPKSIVKRRPNEDVKICITISSDEEDEKENQSEIETQKTATTAIEKFLNELSRKDEKSDPETTSSVDEQSAKALRKKIKNRKQKENKKIAPNSPNKNSSNSQVSTLKEQKSFSTICSDEASIDMPRVDLKHIPSLKPIDDSKIAGPLNYFWHSDEEYV